MSRPGAGWIPCWSTTDGVLDGALEHHEASAHFAQQFDCAVSCTEWAPEPK